MIEFDRNWLQRKANLLEMGMFDTMFFMWFGTRSSTQDGGRMLTQVIAEHNKIYDKC